MKNRISVLWRTVLFAAAASLFLSVFAGCGRTADGGANQPDTDLAEVTAGTTEPEETGSAPVSEAVETLEKPVDTDSPETTAEVAATVQIPGTAATINDPPETPRMLINMIRYPGIDEQAFSAGEDGGLVLSDSGEKADPGFDLRMTEATDILEKISSDVKSGSLEYDVIIAPPAGDLSLLLCEGMLQDLSETGIGISVDSPYVNSGITRDLTVGGRLYLLSSTLTTSDISATWILDLPDGFPDAGLLYSAAISGELSYSKFVEILAGAGVSFSGEQSGSALFTAFGGRILSLSGQEGTVRLFDTASASAYGLALDFLKLSSPVEGLPTVCKAGSASGGTRLPLPYIDAATGHISPVDPTCFNVIAAPGGVIHGHRLAEALGLFGEASSEARSKSALELLAPSGSEDGTGAAEIILSTQAVEAGSVFGWGGLDSTVSSGLSSGRSLSAVGSARDVSDRVNAAKAAASIVMSRNGY